MALKRLTRDHDNVHKHHPGIGDAMAVISALSKGRSSSQMALMCRAASACLHSVTSHIDGWASGTGQPSVARPPPASVTTTSRFGREAVLLRCCLSETLPANSLNAQQVRFPCRRLQHPGHLDRSDDQEQSFLESSIRATGKTLSRDSGDLPFSVQPSWNPSRDCSKIGPSVGMVPQPKVLRWRGGHVASKILVAVAHEWAGISKGVKEIPRAVQACRRSHWLVVIPLINEMIRLGNLAAAQATALTFALYLCPSESLRLRWCPRPGLEHPSALPRAGMSSKVNVYDKNLLLDNQRTSSSSLCSRNSGIRARRCFCSTSVISKGRHPVTARQRVTRSFHRLWRRGGSAEEGPLGQHQCATSVRKAARILQLLQTPAPQELRWSEACRQKLAQLLWAPCGTVSTPRQKNLILLLSTGAPLMVRQFKRTRPWSTLTSSLKCSCKREADTIGMRLCSVDALRARGDLTPQHPLFPHLDGRELSAQRARTLLNISGGDQDLSEHSMARMGARRGVPQDLIKFISHWGSATVERLMHQRACHSCVNLETDQGAHRRDR